MSDTATASQQPAVVCLAAPACTEAADTHLACPWDEMPACQPHADEWLAADLGVLVRHNTADPLACCMRCHGAELARRATRQPRLRYEKLTPGCADWREYLAHGCRGTYYQVFHGARLVALLVLQRDAGRTEYVAEVPDTDQWDVAANGLRTLAGGYHDSLQAGLAATQRCYTAAWRAGR